MSSTLLSICFKIDNNLKKKCIGRNKSKNSYLKLCSDINNSKKKLVFKPKGWFRLYWSKIWAKLIPQIPICFEVNLRAICLLIGLKQFKFLQHVNQSRKYSVLGSFAAVQIEVLVKPDLWIRSLSKHLLLALCTSWLQVNCFLFDCKLKITCFLL